MVNTATELALAAKMVAAYVLLTIASVVTLVLLSAAGSGQATSEAWGHAVIVAVFSALLPLRLRAARRGSGKAALAVVIMAVVVLAVNLVEAILPHAFPVWMRVEMLAVVVVMATLLAAMRGALARRKTPETPSPVR